MIFAIYHIAITIYPFAVVCAITDENWTSFSFKTQVPILLVKHSALKVKKTFKTLHTLCQRGACALNICQCSKNRQSQTMS